MVAAFEQVGHSGRVARRHHGRRAAAKHVEEAAASSKSKHRKRAPKKRCPAKTSSSSSAAATSTIQPLDNSAEDPVTTSKATSSDAEPTTTKKEVTTSSKPVETTTEAAATTTKKTTTSSKAAEETGSSGSDSGDGETFTGDATFFAPGLGACGGTNSDTDYIAAASKILYEEFEGGNSNPNKAPICGKKGIATYQGKSVTFTIVDQCPPCARGSLDFSPSAFKELADLDVGRLKGMTWHFI